MLSPFSRTQTNHSTFRLRPAGVASGFSFCSKTPPRTQAPGILASCLRSTLVFEPSVFRPLALFVLLLLLLLPPPPPLLLLPSLQVEEPPCLQKRDNWNRSVHAERFRRALRGDLRRVVVPSGAFVGMWPWVKSPVTPH